jgi:predicted ATPase/DNA-binding SARP family transcriptional activator
MGQELRVRVLGATELAVDGRPLVGLASAKATALLVYLAVTGTAHSRSALAGLLWSDLPEATARANLRLALTKLRRALPAQLLVTRQTVALDPARPVWVDAVEVERLLAGKPEGEVLLAPARLCRGEFLAGFEAPGAELFDEWVLGRRAASRADQLALLERAVQDARDRTDTRAGVEVARRMLELEPLHEEAHRALMWFLATGDQRGAALAQFETCRYLLREELGQDPSPATTTLRDQIAHAGGFTDLPPGSGAGTTGEGPGAPVAPGPLTSLIGREGDLARLHALLDDPACRLVTLVGPGGIGKTRLALEAGATRRGRHRDGVVTVSFAGTSPARPEEAADLVVTNLAAALGVSLAVPRDPRELLADVLAGRELLLVLDNLEQLRDAAGVLAELLGRAPGVQVLGTSRRRLGLGVEWLVEVPGLPYPPPGADAEAAGYPAVQLFEDRARLLRPGFRPAADLAAVGRVCRLVAGVPLAIELAARWVRSASPAAIADRLAAGGELLATTAPDVEPRHRSMASVLDWSWELLGDGERQALARLSVMRGGFDLDAAAAVAGAGLPLLAGLVDHSLVEVGEDGRHGMHELLRQYAAQRLAADPAEQAEVRRRHAAHFASLLPNPGQALPDAAALDADVENLRAATDWLGRGGRPAGAGPPPHPAVAALPAPRLVPGGAGHPRGRTAAPRRPGARAGPLAPPVGRGARATGRDAPGPGPLRADAGPAGQPPACIRSRLVGHAGQPGAAAAAAAAPAGRPGCTERGPAPPGRRAGHGLLAAPGGLLDAGGSAAPDPARALGAEPVGAGRAARPPHDEPGRPGELAHRGRAAPAGPLPRPRRGGRRRPVQRPRGHLLDLHRGHPPLAGGRRLGGRGRRTAPGAGGGDRGPAAPGRGPGRPPRRRLPVPDGPLRGGRGHGRRRPRGRPRPPRPDGAALGVLVLAEAGLRADPGDPALAGTLDEGAALLASGIPTVDAVRLHVAAARHHLAAGRAEEAWRSIRVAAGLAGPEPSFHPYTIEAHAGIPEVCLALLEGGGAPGADPAELRATAAAGLRRLDRYGRAFPMARPRARLCLGSWQELDGRRSPAVRSWTGAVQAAERLAMPWELARGQLELGRHLAPGERGPGGLDRDALLEQAAAGFAAMGCRAEVEAVRGPVGRPAG